MYLNTHVNLIELLNYKINSDYINLILLNKHTKRKKKKTREMEKEKKKKILTFSNKNCLSNKDNYWLKIKNVLC